MGFKRGYLWGYYWFFRNIVICTLGICMVFISAGTERTQPTSRVSGYVNMTIRDTMENWQSEFLQLTWQVGGLAFLWAVASPQSKTESDRHEEKLDIIIQKLDPQNAKKILQELEAKYPKK
jgi:hypothetical protein